MWPVRLAFGLEFNELKRSHRGSDPSHRASGLTEAHLIGDQSALTLGSKADPFFLEEEKLKPRFHRSERFLPNWDRRRI